MKDPCEKDPCEDCMYEEGSPYCLKYCPYDAKNNTEEPCEDAVSREDAIRVLRADTLFVCSGDKMQAISDIEGLPPVKQEPKTGHCEECKYFCELPYHIDILGRCIRHTEFCPRGDWYCADFESQEGSNKE